MYCLGTSDNSYGYDPNHLPSQGVLQGNGMGPAGWFAIHSILVKVLRDAGFGYKAWTLIRCLVLRIVCFAFIDNNDLIHSNDNPDITTADLIKEAQQMLSMWHGLLWATGGDLAPEKSYWYFVEMHWKDSDWHYKSVEESTGNLWLPGSLSPVERCLSSIVAEALGMFTHPNGHMKDEVRHLRQKVLTWMDGLRTGKVSKHMVWYCLNATIMKTLEYPLVATTFSCQETLQFMKPLLKVALNSFGIQKHLPRALVYGTLQWRGLGIQDPFWT